MFKRNQVAILLAGLLFGFGSAAVAQDCGCTQSQVKKKQEQPCAQRQKPYVESGPTRSIAPRDLHAVYQKEAARAADAANVVEQFTPESMLRDVKAIAVIPGVKKAAFFFGVRWGKGLLTVRDQEGRWIPPSFIQISGGNFGIQAGVESTDLVLIFTNEDAIRSLLRGKLTLNADFTGAAGPIGRRGEVGAPLLFNSGIYALSQSKGAFGGVSLDGAAITVDNSSNQRAYGKYINGDEILLDRRVEVNTVVSPFLNALEMRSPGRTVTQQQSVSPAN
jgi:lipid-binding SYLF domain-containing protein